MTSDTTNFMLIADPQFGIVAFLLNREGGRTTPKHFGETLAPPGTPETGWPYEAANLERALAVASAARPDFVAVLGDMVMNWDNQDQLAAVRESVKALPAHIPVRWVPGNHDVGVEFNSPSRESLERYRQSYGPDRYSFSSGNCRFIALNSALFDRPDAVPVETREQFEWLEAELQRPAGPGVAHTMILAHHPPFIRSIEEERNVYNLPPVERTRLVELLVNNGARYYFAGHTHANTLATHRDLRVIATGAVGLARSGHPSGYRTVRVAGSIVHHSFHRI